MNMSRGTKVLAVAAAAALTLAGCSAAGDDGSDNGTGDSPASSGGTLVVSTPQGAIPQLDPGKATLQWERVLYPLLWDGLTNVDDDNEVVPGLAEEWSHNDDLTSWTFTLRDGVTYSDGSEMTADDVVWNIERTISDDNASIAHGYLSSVESVKASDDDHVVLELSEPDSVIPRALTALRIISPDSEDDINKDPVGTGPFTMKSFVPDQSLSLVPNENYWGDEPSVDEISFVSSNDAASSVTALRTGDIQVLWNIPAADATPLEGDGTISLIGDEGSTQLHYLAVDNTTAPFNDVKARQALSYALDRDKVQDIAYSGFGEPAVYNELVPQNSWAFDKSGLTDYTYDLDKAAQLFKEAGVQSGDTLTWWGIAGAYPEWNKEAQILKSSLSEIGINLKIENNEVGTWVDKFVPIGQEYPGLIIPNAGGDLDDPAFIDGRLVGGGCECNYQDDDVDKLAAQARATTDEAERAEIYQKMHEQFSEQVPEIFSMHTPLLTGLQANVKGVWQAPSGDLHLENAQLTD